jgi:hypothetical protein
MDPQKLSQLDPKLRDVYQRIMGTQVPKPQAVPIPQQSEPVQAQTFAPPPISQIQPQPQTIPAQQPQPAVPAQPSPVFAQMNPQMPTPTPTMPAASNFAAPVVSATLQTQSMAMEKKGGSSIKFILFGILALIFFVIYTLFWTKIFNLKLPFSL